MVVVILLAAQKPAATGWAYAAGAVLSFFALAVALYVGASAAEGAIAAFSLWARRVIFTVIAVLCAVVGVRRLKSRPRRGVPNLPGWVNPWTGTFLGALATVGDLPNAFPLFLAIDHLVDAAVASGAAIGLLGGYTMIYALPTLILLVVGLLLRDRVTAWLERCLKRFTTGTADASWKLAALFFACSAASLGVVALML